MLTPPAKSFYGRYSYKRQLLAEILVAPGAETALLGIFLLSRIFHPDRMAVTALFALNHVSFLAAPWITDRIRKWPAKKVWGLILFMSVPALLAAAVFRGFWGLGPLLVLANAAFVTVMVPLRNRLMRANYDVTERGACYGRVKSMSSGLFFGVALLAALELTDNPSSIYWMLPILAVSSFFGLLVFKNFRVRGEKRALARERQHPRKSIKEIYGQLYRLYRDHKGFRSFEIGFMLYGMGFMFTIPLEIAAVSKNTSVSPVEIVIAIHGLTPFIKVLFVPFFGRLLDQVGASRTAALSFLLLALYPLSVWAAVSTGSVLVWFLARGVFGMSMAGVDVCWSLGPVMFGGPDHAARYSAAHIFAVGMRAAIMPFLGLLVYQSIGNGTYGVAAVILIGAAIHMVLQRRDQSQVEVSSL